jgi:ribosomal protein S18 acetylase RimI-like enzyme
MIGSHTGLAASQNLAHTYFELGRATPGAYVSNEEGFDVCVGPFEHPICNFAANLRLDPWSTRRLAEFALRRRAFHVYSLPTDRPTHRDELLQRVGFRPTYRLCQMVCEPTIATEPADLTPVTEPGERLKVTEFMVGQFFSRQPYGFRRQVAEATAAASALDLFTLEVRSKTAGAVMVSRSEGMLGIYNLCVSTEHQSRGWGASVVAAILARAASLTLAVTLQCEPKLESWYAKLGFRTIGVVDVYGLPKGTSLDIIH